MKIRSEDGEVREKEIPWRRRSKLARGITYATRSHDLHDARKRSSCSEEVRSEHSKIIRALLRGSVGRPWAEVRDAILARTRLTAGLFQKHFGGAVTMSDELDFSDGTPRERGNGRVCYGLLVDEIGVLRMARAPLVPDSFRRRVRAALTKAKLAGLDDLGVRRMSREVAVEHRYCSPVWDRDSVAAALRKAGFVVREERYCLCVMPGGGQ